VVVGGMKISAAAQAAPEGPSAGVMTAVEVMVLVLEAEAGKGCAVSVLESS
jgi:hypothetical protein